METEFVSPIVLQTTAKKSNGIIEWKSIDPKYKSLFMKNKDEIERQVYLRLESMTLIKVNDDHRQSVGSCYLYCSDTIDDRFLPVGDGCLSNINNFLSNINPKNVFCAILLQLRQLLTHLFQKLLLQPLKWL